MELKLSELVGKTYNEAWNLLGVPKLLQNQDGTLEAIAPNTVVGIEDGNEFISAMTTGDEIIKDEHDALSVLYVAEALLEDSFEIMDSAGAATSESATTTGISEEKSSFGKKLATGMVCASIIGAGIGTIISKYAYPNINLDISVEKTDFSKTTQLWINGSGHFPINDISLKILNETGFSILEKDYSPNSRNLNIEEIVNMTTMTPGNYTLKLDAKAKMGIKSISKTFELPNLPPIIDVFDINSTNRSINAKSHVFDVDSKIIESGIYITNTNGSPLNISGLNYFTHHGLGCNQTDITRQFSYLSAGEYHLRAFAKDKFNGLIEDNKTANVENILPVIKDFFVTDDGKIFLNATDDIDIDSGYIGVNQTNTGTYSPIVFDGTSNSPNNFNFMFNLTDKPLFSKGLWGDIKLLAHLNDNEDGWVEQTIWKNVSYGGMPQLKSLNVIARQNNNFYYSGNLSVFSEFEDDAGIWKKKVNAINPDSGWLFGPNPEILDTTFIPSVKNFTSGIWINDWELNNKNVSLLAKLWDIEGNYIEILKDIGLSEPVNATLTLNNTKKLDSGLLNSWDDLIGTEKMPNFWLNATHPIGIFSAQTGLGIYNVPEGGTPPSEEILVPPLGIDYLDTEYPIKILNTTLNQFNFYGGELPKQINTNGTFNLTSYHGLYTLLSNMAKFGCPKPTTNLILNNISLSDWAPVVIGFNAYQDWNTGETHIFYNATDLDGCLQKFELTAVNKDTLERIFLKNETGVQFVSDLPLVGILPPGRYGFEFNLTDFNGNNRIVEPFNQVLVGPENENLIAQYPKIIISNVVPKIDELTKVGYAEGLAWRGLVEESILVKSLNGTIIKQEKNIFPTTMVRWSNFSLGDLSGLDEIILELSYKDQYGKSVFLNESLLLSEPLLKKTEIAAYGLNSILVNATLEDNFGIARKYVQIKDANTNELVTEFYQNFTDTKFLNDTTKIYPTSWRLPYLRDLSVSVTYWDFEKNFISFEKDLNILTPPTATINIYKNKQIDGHIDSWDELYGTEKMPIISTEGSDTLGITRVLLNAHLINRNDVLAFLEYQDSYLPQSIDLTTIYNTTEYDLLKNRPYGFLNISAFISKSDAYHAVYKNDIKINNWAPIVTQFTASSPSVGKLLLNLKYIDLENEGSDFYVNFTNKDTGVTYYNNFYGGTTSGSFSGSMECGTFPPGAYIFEIFMKDDIGNGRLYKSPIEVLVS